MGACLLHSCGVIQDGESLVLWGEGLELSPFLLLLPRATLRPEVPGMMLWTADNCFSRNLPKHQGLHSQAVPRVLQMERGPPSVQSEETSLVLPPPDLQTRSTSIPWELVRNMQILSPTSEGQKQDLLVGGGGNLCLNESSAKP